jgi:hypothetical protein
MIAKVETLTISGSPNWEVILSVWEGDRCVFAGRLDDNHHGKRWHQAFAEEVASRINATERFVEQLLEPPNQERNF